MDEYGFGGCPGDAAPYDTEAYGLAGLFDVIAAPFKAIGKAVYSVGKRVVQAVPAAASGFIAGGPVGAVTAAGATVASGVFSGSDAYEPYPTVYEGGVATPGIMPTQYPQLPDLKTVAGDVWAAARGELMRQAGTYVATTPEGQAAIQQEATKKVGSTMLPILLGGGALLFLLRR